MKRYILTVTPEDGDGATTVVHIDVNRGRPRIKQVTVTAGEGQYLPQMPFDIEGFLGTVLPGHPAPSAAVTSATQAPAELPDPDQSEVEHVDQLVAAVLPAATSPERPPAMTAEPVERQRRAARGRSAPTSTPPAKIPAAAKATKATKATEAKKTGRGASAATTVTKTAVTKKGRGYHKMPDDFVISHGKTTMRDLADVYDVPLHTIQAWVNTARKQGRIPAATPRKKR